MKIPFVSGAYQDRSPNFDAEECQNLYVNIDKEGGKEILTLFGVPGLKEWSLDTIFEGNLRFSGYLSHSLYPYEARTNLYVLFSSGTNPTIVSVYFSGSSLDYTGKYVSSSSGNLSGLTIHDTNLITIWGHGSTAVVRKISKTPVSGLLPFIADYSLLVPYDFPTATGANIIVDSVNDWVYITNNTGRIVKLSGMSSRLLRAFHGDLTTAVDGSVLYYGYVYENYAWSYSRPASGGGGYWEDTVDDGYDQPPLTTWGSGTIRTSESDIAYMLLYDNSIYVAQYDSPYSRLSKYDGTTLAYSCRKSDTDYGRSPVGYDGVIYTNHGLYNVNTVRAYNSSTLALITSRTGLSGGWGNTQIMDGKLILVTANYTGTEGRLYKLDKDTLATISVITPVRAGGFIKKINEQFVAQCTNNYIDVYNVSTMTLVASLNIRDHGILSAYNSTACAVQVI